MIWLDKFIQGYAPKKVKKMGRRREVRFPGICNAAEALGVSRVHLRLVLSGERQSRSLMKRYESLKSTGKDGR